MARSCLLTYTKLLTLNLSGDLVIEWFLSDHLCLLRQIFFLASARAYLMASRSRRTLSSP